MTVGRNVGKRRAIALLLVALAGVGAQTLAHRVAAQEAVVARVNGRIITEADLKLAESEIGNDLGALPPAQMRRVLVEYLVETLLFAEAAEKDKLGSGQGFDAIKRYWDRRALRDAYFERSVKGTVSEAEARTFYDKEVASAQSQDEVRARHILLDSEQQAKELYEKIAHGDDFGKLARQFSKDPGSKDDGGDLGYFTRGRMVPQFEEAAYKLEKGDVSLPVKSQFGWHLIKVEDKRRRTAPAYDTIKERIVASLIHRRAQEIGQNLRAKANLEFVDPALKAEIERDSAARTAPTGAAPKR